MSQHNPEVSAKFGTLQLLDDAIAFRQNRLSLPCPDCSPDEKCTDHSSDLSLVATYQEQQETVYSELLTQMDEADAELVKRLSAAGTPIIAALSVALLGLFKELLTDGPLVVELEGRGVVLELEGPTVVERVLAAAGGGD